MQQHKRFQGADLHCDCLMYNPRGEALWIWVFWKLFPFIFCSYYFYFLSRKMWVYQNNTDEMYGKQVNIVSVWTTRTPCKKVRVKWVTQSSSLFLYGSVPLQGHLFSLFLGTLSKINLTKLCTIMAWIKAFCCIVYINLFSKRSIALCQAYNAITALH